VIGEYKKLDFECGMILYKWTNSQLAELNTATTTKATSEQSKADDETIDLALNEMYEEKNGTLRSLGKAYIRGCFVAAYSKMRGGDGYLEGGG
jgi:hypothetical protein